MEETTDTRPKSKLPPPRDHLLAAVKQEDGERAAWALLHPLHRQRRDGHDEEQRLDYDRKGAVQDLRTASQSILPVSRLCASKSTSVCDAGALCGGDQGDISCQSHAHGTPLDNHDTRKYSSKVMHYKQRSAFMAP